MLSSLGKNNLQGCAIQKAHLDVLVGSTVLDGGQESGTTRTASHEALGGDASNRSDSGHTYNVDVETAAGSGAKPALHAILIKRMYPKLSAYNALKRYNTSINYNY